MKKCKLVITTLVVLALCFLVSCSTETETTNEPSIESTKANQDLAQQLANEFTFEAGTGYGKKLEDAWKANPEDEQIAAMYFYYNAKFYYDIDKKDMAVNEMKRISPNYTGVMNKEIISFGLILFDSKDTWASEYENKNDSINKITDAQRTTIKNWINNRYDYFDNIEGQYTGDKYTVTIFIEAADEFGYTYEEISNIWSDLPI